MGKMSPDAIRDVLMDCILSVAPEAEFGALRVDRPWREQLEIDSFDFQNILVAIDSRLGVNVPESDYRKLSTLDETVAYLAARLPA